MISGGELAWHKDQAQWLGWIVTAPGNQAKTCRGPMIYLRVEETSLLLARFATAWSHRVMKNVAEGVGLNVAAVV